MSVKRRRCQTNDTVMRPESGVRTVFDTRVSLWPLYADPFAGIHMCTVTLSAALTVTKSVSCHKMSLLVHSTLRKTRALCGDPLKLHELGPSLRPLCYHQPQVTQCAGLAVVAVGGTQEQRGAGDVGKAVVAV